MTKEERRKSLLPGGVPKWVRCYDNGGGDKKGGTFDRYTVIYTRAHCFGMRGRTVGRGLSVYPCHPQGFGQWIEYDNHRDLKGGTIGGNGKRIRFLELPEDCSKVVLQDYKELWGLNEKEGKR